MYNKITHNQVISKVIYCMVNNSIGAICSLTQWNCYYGIPRKKRNNVLTVAIFTIGFELPLKKKYFYPGVLDYSAVL